MGTNLYITFRYKGFYSYDWITLTPAMVRNIHREGGMIDYIIKYPRNHSRIFEGRVQTQGNC